MHYFEVLVAGLQYHGKDALTYSADEHIPVGSIVTVPLRAKSLLGVVVREVPKPKFSAKPITEVFAIQPLSPVTFKMIEWLYAYYPAPSGAVVQLFLPNSLLNKHVSGSVTSSVEAPADPDLPALTPEQSDALKQIEGSGTFILHGETGSGKTRVYLELARKAITQGLSALILTPEISLTSQLAQAFRTTFGDRVVVMHSQLTGVARQKVWLRIAQSKEPLVVIGPRSILFSPVRKIGVIVIDEAHENSYKQDQAPHYHAARVAAKLGQIHQSQVVLGSATPPVVDYFLAEQKKRPIIRMQELAKGKNDHTTKITVVDLKDRTKFSRSPYLSTPLLKAIQETLSKKEQVLLFLNRRGTARVVFCEKCGWQAACPHCDTPLVYHGDNHRMRCHICGFQQPAISSCPSCHNPSIVFKTIGTKAIAEEVANLFPHVRVERYDNDNKRDERIEQHYEAVKQGAVDIIVGTQTLAKGLDLPKLGLVGVVLADTSLYLPDYGSQERTYQLLAQVIGRIGRGHRESQAVIQTYAPDSPILEAILKKDWQGFYQKELSEREAFTFPPFCYVLKLSCRRASISAAKKAATDFAAKLASLHYRISIEGPAPSFHEKIMGKYQWQLIIKAKDRNELLKIIPELPSGWSHDIDPMNLL